MNKDSTKGEKTVQYYDRKAVGSRIQKIRKSKNMTQCVLAELLDYTNERQLQRIECGETACSVDKLMEIAQILDISTDFLLFGTARSESGMLEKMISDRNEDDKKLLAELVKKVAISIDLITYSS